MKMPSGNAHIELASGESYMGILSVEAPSKQNDACDNHADVHRARALGAHCPGRQWPGRGKLGQRQGKVGRRPARPELSAARSCRRAHCLSCGQANFFLNCLLLIASF